MTVKLYKDGDNMAIAALAADEEQFIEEISHLFSEMIDRKVFEFDWGFQLILWLPQVVNIYNQYREWTAKIRNQYPNDLWKGRKKIIIASKTPELPPLIARYDGGECVIY